MPTFLVIGAARSGTTALFAYLAQHPDVFMSPVKEPNFFAFEGVPLDFQGPGADFVNNSVACLADYEALFAGATSEKARGEASPLYLYAEQAPARIYEHVPEAKLIAVLRNPIEQAFSHYLYAKRNVIEPLDDFTSALAAEPERLEAHWQPMFQYSRFPRYHEQLSRYYALFPADQIKVYLYEDFNESPLRVIEEIFAFIGVDEKLVPDLGYKPNAGGVPKNRLLQDLMMKPYGPTKLLGSLLPQKLRQRIKDAVSDRNLERPEFPHAARARLLADLGDDIMRLQELLDRDLSAWLE